MMKKKKPLNDTYDEESSFTHAEEKIEDSSDKKEQEETVQNKPDIICPRCHSNCVQITSSEEMYNGTVFFIGQCRDCGKKGLFKLDL